MNGFRTALLVTLACIGCSGSGSSGGSGGGTATGGASGTGGGTSATGGGSTATGGGTSSTGGGSTATGGGSTATGGGSTATGGGSTATGGGSSSTGGGSTATGGGSSSTGGGSGGGSGTDGGVGSTCGGFPGAMCSASNVCLWMDESCGDADGTGTCQARPLTCSAVSDPVCACNGQIYDNACKAQVAGFDVSVSNGCTPPSNTFRCGPRFCNVMSQYCEAVVGGAIDNPGTYTCKPLPGTCQASPECTCLSDVMCGTMCAGEAGTGLTVTCQTP